MQRELIMRNVVCAAEDVDAADFDVDGFAEHLDLGGGESKVRLGNLSLTEWEKARLQIRPDRVQLGFKESADGKFVRRVAEAFLLKTDDIAPVAPVEINAALLLTLDESDPDPSAGLLDAGNLVESLGGSDARGGATLVYRDELSRWWVEISPQPDQDRLWVFDFNRRFANFPDPGGDRDGVLDWFASVDSGLVELFETICVGTE